MSTTVPETRGIFLSRGTSSKSLWITVFQELSLADRLLPLAIVLAILLGVLLSVYVPSAREAFNSPHHELVGVSAPLAVGLIIMMVPPLCKVEWEKFHILIRNKSLRNQLLFSCVLNWIVCPFLMFGLSWLVLFNHEEYRIGIIMIGLARCIAMVLVWNEIAGGDNTLCVLIVLVNSCLQIVLYAPYQLFFCYVITGGSPKSNNMVDYSLVSQSVGVFLGVPLGLSLLIRFVSICLFSQQTFDKKIMSWIKPWAPIGLIYTIIVIFIQKGNDFIKNIGVAFLCFIPLTLYFLITWFGTFFLVRFLSSRGYRRRLLSESLNEDGTPRDSDELCGCEKQMLDFNVSSIPLQQKLNCSASYEDTVTQTFTAASNNFELSLAIAIAIYGSGSEQSIAATFGPLLEIPILLVLTVVARFFRLKLFWRDTESNN